MTLERVVKNYYINPKRGNIMNHKTRIVLACLMMAVLAMVLTACDSTKNETKPAATDTPAATATEAPTPEPTATSTPVPTETPTPTNTPSPSPTPAYDYETLHNTEYTSLKEAYKDYFMIGTIYTEMILSGKDKDLVLANYDIITPENLMKPEEMQRTQGTFKYTASDKMMEFAQANKLTVHGHCLAWHQQSGNWLGTSAKDREEAIEQLRAHINGVAGHYQGQIYSWDVVNEAINDGVNLPADGDWKKCLRQSQWTKSIGDDYIEIAFQLAHEAAPDAKLYYNDYNLDQPAKAKIVAAMVADMKSRGIPIDGIGMQGHYSTTTSITNVRNSLEMFGKIDGITVSVSELDVQINGIKKGQYDGEQEMQQAIFYARLFNLYKEYSDLIERVTFWGYKDNTSWRADSAPLLFKADLSPKEAYYAVLNPDAYAALGPQEVKPSTKKLEAAKGTPTIDGEIDDCWSAATAYDINIAVMAWQGAKGTVKYMWDENNFYALFEVADSVLNKDNSNTYEQDSIELFLDQNNCKESTYDKNCGQYRCNYESELSYGTVPSKDGVTAKAVKTATGYRVEIAVPMLIEAKEGVVMGVDGHINDANDKGARVSVMKLNATQDSDYTNPAAWAEITLK